MRSLLGLRIPVIARRLVTLIPAVVVLSLGADPTRSLVISQVILSIGIPFALVPLVWLTARRDVMGAHPNHPLTTRAAAAAGVVIIALNVVLLWLTVTG